MDPVPPSLPGTSGGDPNSDRINSLLEMARQRLSEGNPALALHAVVMALRASGGERAVMEALGKAREVYHARMRANEEVDELSALLAGCGLETSATNLITSRFQNSGADSREQSGVQEMDTMERHEPGIYQTSKPILAESGRLQVVMDASSDGSSFVCVQCGGVVSNQRRDEHVAFWCTKTHQ